MSTLPSGRWKVRTRALLAGVALALAACSNGEAVGPPAPSTTTSTTPSTTTTTSSTTTSTSTTTTTAPKAAAPSGLVDVTEVEPTIVVALKRLTADNSTGAPLPGYEANRAFLTPEGAQALARVQRRLAPQGVGLKLYDAYRPLRATRAMVDWARSQGRGDLVGPYIASLSFHNSGQAVDLTLVDRATGRELDMGVPYDTYTPAANTANATGQAATNRALLRDAMHAEGFENYPGEWWHYNFFVAGAAPLDEPVR